MNVLSVTLAVPATLITVIDRFVFSDGLLSLEAV